MTDELFTQTVTPILAPISDPPFHAEAELYFLPGGHYLFRQASGGKYKSKYVTATDVQAAFSGVEQDSGWMPAGVVRCGQNVGGIWFVYSTPAQKVEITLLGEIAQVITIPVPRTVLFGYRNRCWMWVSGSQHFDPNGKAFHAPFPNVHGDGRICWGQNAPALVTPQQARSTWEKFFATPFNEHLVSGKSQKYYADVHQVLLSVAGRSKYPLSDLVPTRSSIAKLIDELLTEETHAS